MPTHQARTPQESQRGTPPPSEGHTRSPYFPAQQGTPKSVQLSASMAKGQASKPELSSFSIFIPPQELSWQGTQNTIIKYKEKDPSVGNLAS